MTKCQRNELVMCVFVVEKKIKLKLNSLKFIDIDGTFLYIEVQHINLKCLFQILDQDFTIKEQ